MKLKYKKIFVSASILFLLTGLVFSLIGYQYLKAKGSDDCFVCHEDKDLTMEKNGKKISIYINPEDYKKSPHGGAECTDCHQNYNPDNIPHNPLKSLASCKDCHGEIKSGANNVHSNVACANCHNPHNIVPKKELEANQTNNCLNCHQNKNVQAFKQSMHYKKNVKCENCHNGGHEVKKISKGESQQLCGKCHAKHNADFNNSIHQLVLSQGNNKAPTCVDCHGSHNIINSKVSIESQACLKCHLDTKMFPGEERGSAKFVTQYKTSIHSFPQQNGLPAAGCVDCHGDHMIDRAVEPGTSTVKAKMLETCGKCHSDVVNNYKNSAHGKQFQQGNKDAPSCVTCHGEHSVKSVKLSDEFSKINQADLCLGCHTDGKIKSLTDLNSHTDLYKQSFHYKALEKGNLNAATCSDCHGAHQMNSSKDSTSNINKKNVANTCGKAECHTKQLSEFNGSVHQIAITSKLNSDAPSCVNCHGNHQILNKDDQGNKISNSKGIVQLCANCHASVEMIKNNDLPLGVAESYNESFHGLATRSGSKVAANCESCHGNHNIRNSTDTLSSINKKNLPVTCGKCHPGATSTFFDAPVHAIVDRATSPALFWISRIYIALIIMVIGGMVLHNILDLRKKLKHKHKKS
jgi:predicted CXXCH cytochrome family protein